MTEEHELFFEVTATFHIVETIEEEEYQDFKEKGESRAEYARRRINEYDKMENYLTREVADDGITRASESIELGDCIDHWSY